MHFKRNKISPKRGLRIQPANKRRKKTKGKRDVHKYLSSEKNKRLEKSFNRLSIGPRTRKKGNKSEIRSDKQIQRKISIRDEDLDNKKYKKLSKWRGLLKGYPAFLLGNAPSISKQNLSLLDHYFTIGVNRIFYIYHPTILLWQDRQLWMSDKINIIKSRSIKVCRDLADPREMFLNFKLGFNPFRFTKNPKHFYGRGNTGAIAAELAVALGCSSLIILGMDCKYGKKDYTDFYGKNKDHTKYTLDRCKYAMEWLKKECLIPIYNCSKINLWPKRELKDVIDEIKPKKFNRKYFEKLFRK